MCNVTQFGVVLTAMGNDEGLVEIYTDGGCEPNPGTGGWGAVLLYGELIDAGEGDLRTHVRDGGPDGRGLGVHVRAPHPLHYEELSALAHTASGTLHALQQIVAHAVAHVIPEGRDGDVLADELRRSRPRTA